MERVTSNLCVASASLGKKSNEELMSLGNMGLGSLGGPSKRTRQSTRKNTIEALEAPILASTGIIQCTVEVGKEMENIIKELLQALVMVRICWVLV